MNQVSPPKKGWRAAVVAAIGLGASIPVSVALDGLFALLLLPVGWLLAGQRTARFRQMLANPVARAALLLYGLLAISSLWSLGSIADIGNGLSKYKALVVLALLMPAFSQAKVREWGIKAWLAAMLVTLALSLLIWAGLLPTPARGLTGSAANPTVFKLHITQNLFMAYAAFLLALLAKRTSGGKRWALGALALLASVDVFLVAGRTGWAAFVVLLVYLAIHLYRWKGVFLAGLLMVCLGVPAWYGSKNFHSRLNETEQSVAHWKPGVAATTSDGVRLEFWTTTLKIIRQHPVLGVGVGGFSEAYAATVKGTPIPPSHNPHNQYLLMLAQLGPVGLLAMLYLFFVIWRDAPRLTTGHDTALARGFLLAMAVGCLFNSFLIDHSEGLFFAWACAILFANYPVRTVANKEPV